MARIFYDEDADLSVIKDKTIAVVGYGNQGRSQALNMRDSGLKVIIGSVNDDSWKKAEEDGFQVYPIDQAAEQADIIFLLIPDEIMVSVFEQDIAKSLKQGDVLNFASGYNIAFDLMKVPDFVDLTMVAPRMIGAGVRDCYVSGEGFPSFVGVEQDASGKAWDIALALCKAIGSTKRGSIELTFRQEAEMDLLTEQGFGPILHALIKDTFEFEVEMGYPPEAVLLELYMSGELSYVFAQAAKIGLLKQSFLHSHTSQYGHLIKAHEVDHGGIKSFLGTALDDIKSGKFTEQWQAEQANGSPVFKELTEKAHDSSIIQAEAKLRKQLGYDD